MKKPIIMFVALGAMAFTACSTDTSKTETTTETTTAQETEDVSASSYDYDNEYRERSTRLSAQVSQELRLDTAAQSRLQAAYYNRIRKMEELQSRYRSTDQSAGSVADSGYVQSDTDMSMRPDSEEMQYPETYYTELKTIDTEVDTEVKGFLTPEQFKVYNANRQKYFDMDMKYKTEYGSKMKIDGDDSKVKTDDSKMKIDGDESKLKVGDTKVKRDGDEIKIKNGDTKIKKDGNETKAKTDDGKIKIEE